MSTISELAEQDGVFTLKVTRGSAGIRYFLPYFEIENKWHGVLVTDDSLPDMYMSYNDYDDDWRVWTPPEPTKKRWQWVYIGERYPYFLVDGGAFKTEQELEKHLVKQANVKAKKLLYTETEFP